MSEHEPQTPPESPRPTSTRSEDGSSRPFRTTTAAEFQDAISRLYAAGFWFDDSATLCTVPGDTAQPMQLLLELQEQYPYLPTEVQALALASLTGSQPDPDLVGPPDEASAKFRVMEDRVLTEEYREKFFLKHCGKIPRFRALDWEVVVKYAERGFQRPPGFPYALVTLEAVNDVHGHHEHETLAFTIGKLGLQTLIKELQEILSCLRQCLPATASEAPDNAKD